MLGVLTYYITMHRSHSPPLTMAYIGQGKFATVYKAESADNKIVALKKVKVNNIFVQCILKLVEIYYYLYLKSIFICKG